MNFVTISDVHRTDSSDPWYEIKEKENTDTTGRLPNKLPSRSLSDIVYRYMDLTFLVVRCVKYLLLVSGKLAFKVIVSCWINSMIQTPFRNILITSVMVPMSVFNAMMSIKLSRRNCLPCICLKHFCTAQCFASGNWFLLHVIFNVLIAINQNTHKLQLEKPVRNSLLFQSPSSNASFNSVLEINEECSI